MGGIPPTPGLVGGAHPFALLDRSVVHNGGNLLLRCHRRAIEMYGYECDLLTDTEVITTSLTSWCGAGA